MSAQINENTQFLSESGKPIVNGSLYIGTKGLNPKLNTISIYSDRALTTVLGNPQTLDSSGRSTNKIWIPGVYSFRVDNTNGVQKLINLDAGTVETTGTTILSDVQGTNTVSATATPTIEEYVDGQIYILQPANDNTDATTLDIDSLGAKTITLTGTALEGGELVSGLNSTVAYNEDNDNFDLLGTTRSEYEAWNSAITYSATSSAIGSDGMLYFSLVAANLNNDPVTDATSTNWRAADQMRSVDAGGTVDAITATYIPAVGALKNELIVRVRALGANATTTPTFAPNGLTAKTIVKNGNQALVSGDIFGADHELLLVYNSSNDNWELLNPVITPGLGDGQTWQDVIGSRSVNTTYTNTTGRPIFVSVTVSNASSNVSISVDGSITLNDTDTTANVLMGLTTIVPDGLDYSVAGTTLAIWKELR
jgi:hypothetical protein